eukprot:scaffold39199_cov18-Prasinocladus_malaysianus.AAC.1
MSMLIDHETDEDDNRRAVLSMQSPNYNRVFCITRGFIVKVRSGSEAVIQMGPGEVLGVTPLLTGASCSKL